MEQSINYKIIDEKKQRPKHIPDESKYFKHKKLWFFIDKNDVYFSWNMNGKKYSRNETKDGKFHGKTTFWWLNEKKAREGYYNNAKLHGYWTYWNKDGSLKEKSYYKNGRLLKRKFFGAPNLPKGVPLKNDWHSQKRKWIYYYKKLQIQTIYKEDGHKFEEGKFINGTREELWTVWSGQTKFVGRYKNSKREGIWKAYNKKNKLVRIIYFKNDKIIKQKNP